MRICPKCHTQYDDSMSFCVKDGCQLQEVSSNASNQDVKPTRKKTGCLKKILVIVVVLILGAFLLYRYLMNAATYLRVEPEVLTAAKAGGMGKVDIDYDGYIWVINHKPDWVAIDESENSFVVKVASNKTGQNREGSITIQSGKLLAQVVVRQLAYATVMKVSENQLHFAKEGGQKTVELETDGCEWKAQFPDWIDLKENELGNLNISCSDNDGEYRTGMVTIQEDQVSVTISLIQEGECDVCHGKGEVTCNSCWGMGSFGFGLYSNSCFICGGQGKIECAACGGTGYRE